MNRIARFEKVSKEKFFEWWKDTLRQRKKKRWKQSTTLKTAGKSDSRKCRI